MFKFATHRRYVAAFIVGLLALAMALPAFAAAGDSHFLYVPMAAMGEGRVIVADTLENDVIAEGNNTIMVNGATTITYVLIANASPNADHPGCNVTESYPATLTIITPAGVTATPNSVDFIDCDAESVVFESDTPGEHFITHEISGGLPPVSHPSGTDRESKYNNHADFTLHVLEGEEDNEPPTIIVPAAIEDFEGNTTGGADVTWLATAEDGEDDDLTGSIECASDLNDYSQDGSGNFSGFFQLGTTEVTCTVEDSGGSSDTKSFNVTVVDTTPPEWATVLDITTHATGDSQAVVTYDTPTATDTVDPSPTVSCEPASGSSFSVGTTTVTCTATDASGNSSEESFDVTVVYDFEGFFNPVANNKLNKAKAGSAIPLKFTLHGDQGLDIFADGSPKSQKVTCTGEEPEVASETTTAGSSSLSYDAGADQYNYVWKTDKSWAGTCRQLLLGLIDGESHPVIFNFTK